MISDDRVPASRPEDARRHAHHVEPDLLECPAQQPVHLVAPPAPATLDDLVVRFSRVEADRVSEVHAEILVRDAQKMLVVDGLECVGVWARDTIEPDSVQVGLKIHGARSCTGPPVLATGSWPSPHYGCTHFELRTGPVLCVTFKRPGHLFLRSFHAPIQPSPPDGRHRIVGIR